MGTEGNGTSALYDLEVHADGSFVVVRSFRAPITLDIAVSFTAAFTRLGDEQGLRRCLIDIRPVYDDSSILDKFDYAYRKASDAGLDQKWRVAVLKRAEDHSPDFIETVMTNAGYDFRLFDDQVAALEWLEILPRA